MPEMFDAIRDFGVTSRAFERNLVTLTVVNPRTFADDRHGTVDDRPYGGGPGMVLKAEPMLAAVKAAKAAVGGGADRCPFLAKRKATGSRVACSVD